MIDVKKVLAENERLKQAIRDHRSQKADDRCIEDDDRLYEALGDGIKCDRRVGDRMVMVKNCLRFVTQRCEGGGPWKSYVELEKEIEDLRKEVARLQSLNEGLCERVAAQSQLLTDKACKNEKTFQ